tara:strand:+ start:320 stop:583 length:264 start_codon:yes stop_codon:yes gene_type:complete
VAATTARAGWGKTMDAAFVAREMGGLLGNRGVLDRTAGDLVVMTANPGGKMQPYNRAGRFIPECRLPYSTVLVESGVADIVVHPETG